MVAYRYYGNRVCDTYDTSVYKIAFCLKECFDKTKIKPKKEDKALKEKKWKANKVKILVNVNNKVHNRQVRVKRNIADEISSLLNR